MKNILSVLMFVLSMFVIGCGNTSTRSYTDEAVGADTAVAESDATDASSTNVEAANEEETSSERTSSEETSSSTTEQGGNRTYEFTDNAGKTFVLVLNSDKTATWSIKGQGKVHHVSWGKHREGGENVRIGEHHMPIVWPEYDGHETVVYVRIKDGYIYEDVNACNAKDPDYRLKLKEIH